MRNLTAIKGSCVYCEKEGIVVRARGLPGLYHLRCIKDAKEAWDSARGESFLQRLLYR